MNIKKALIIWSLSTMLLPLEGNTQNTIQTTKKEIMENIDSTINIEINTRIIDLVDYQKPMLIYINQIRKENWLPPLKYDKDLEKAAINHSKYLKENRPEWHKLDSHDHIDWLLRMPVQRIEDIRWERFEKPGKKKTGWENIITLNRNSPKRAIDLRLWSPWHRANILWEYTHLWVGYAIVNWEKSNYFITVFAKEKENFQP